MSGAGPGEPTATRFIARPEHVRSDRTLKSDAFVPPPSLELSVTMLHGDGAEVWQRGIRVIAERMKTFASCKLVGRGDIRVTSIIECRPLTIQSDPTPEDPHHAIIVDWPLDKAARKALAIQLADRATFVPHAA